MSRSTAVPRRAVPAAIVSAGLFAVVLPASAGADVARLVVPKGGETSAPTDASVSVTAPDGARRTLGPFRLPQRPGSMVASPDGSRLLVAPEALGEGTLHVLPTAGGPPVPLRLPAGVTIAEVSASGGWAVDGSSVLFGDALRDTDGETTTRRLSWTAVRCDTTSGACAELPTPAGSAPGGLATGFPGGSIASSSLPSVLPRSLLFTDTGQSSKSDDGTDDALTGWLRPSSVGGRRVLADLRRPVESTTRIVATGNRVVGRSSTRLGDGVPYAVSVVGGPSGALVVRATLRTRTQRRDGRFRVLARIAGPRLLTVAPDGRSRRGPLPVVPLGAADRRRAGLDRREALRFVPALGRPAGWLGFAGTIDGEGSTSSTALATMDDRGRARAVLVGGRLSTGEELLRFVPAAAGRRVIAPDVDLVGLERSTDTAVVTVRWYRSERELTTLERMRIATLRVPLAGGRPTVVAGTVDAAW